MELEMRVYQILYPAHECIGRPYLPFPGLRDGPPARHSQSLRHGSEARARASVPKCSLINS